MIGQVWWFATRSAGLMTWATSTASVIVGLLLASRALGRRPTGPWLLDLHRYLGGLTVVFLAAHMVTLWADSYVHFGLAELFVPGASAWRTGAVAWGVVAAWLVAAIEVSSLIKDRLPQRLWHGIHLSSFAVMGMGTVHAWQAGSDVGNTLVTVVAAVMGLAVAVLAGQRLRLRAKAEAARQERRAALAQARQAASPPMAAPSPAPSPPTVEAAPSPPTVEVAPSPPTVEVAPRPAVAAPAAPRPRQRPVSLPSERRPHGVDLPPRGVPTGVASPMPLVARLRPSSPGPAAVGAGDGAGLPPIGAPADRRRPGPAHLRPTEAPDGRRSAVDTGRPSGRPAPTPVRRVPGPRSTPPPGPEPRLARPTHIDPPGPRRAPTGSSSGPAAPDAAGPVRRPPAPGAVPPRPTATGAAVGPGSPAAGDGAPARPSVAPDGPPPPARPPVGGGGAAGPRRRGPQRGPLDAADELPSTLQS